MKLAKGVSKKIEFLLDNENLLQKISSKMIKIFDKDAPKRIKRILKL